jgi:hypothetical protein
MKARTTVLLAALACLFQPTARADIVYDATHDFSPINNPNSVWAYGWSSSLFSPLHLYSLTSPMETNGVTFWYDPAFQNSSISHYPNVGENTTASSKTDGGLLTWQPGQMSLHPGLAGEYTHVRWTSPLSGLMQLDAQFDGSIQASFLPAPTTDVHVILNGVPIFDGFVLGAIGSASFNFSLPVIVGDVLDFAAGIGPDGTATSDTTAFQARISIVPSIIYQYDFYTAGTTTVATSLRFPGFVRDVSPASVPIPGFTGFLAPSPASLHPCDLTSNSSAELDCRAPTVHSGIFYFGFDYGAFPSNLGSFTGSGFIAPDGATPSIGTVPLLNGQIRDVTGQP